MLWLQRLIESLQRRNAELEAEIAALDVLLAARRAELRALLAAPAPAPVECGEANGCPAAAAASALHAAGAGSTSDSA